MVYAILVQVRVLFLMSFTERSLVRDVEVLCGKTKYPANFRVLGSAASKTCPIIFGRPFLNTCGVAYLCFICASPGSTASTHSYKMKYQEYKGLYYNA
jgi:hypothetical protein